jgi:single-strand DNA-binding protein
MRQAGNSDVCSFGMASNKKVKGEDQATFIDVSIFGKRGETLCQYLTKGSFVVVYGELSTRTHNDKLYIQLDCQGVDLGPKSSGQSSGQRQERKAPADDYDKGGDDDPIPF